MNCKRFWTKWWCLLFVKTFKSQVSTKTDKSKKTQLHWFYLFSLVGSHRNQSLSKVVNCCSYWVCVTRRSGIRMKLTSEHWQRTRRSEGSLSEVSSCISKTSDDFKKWSFIQSPCCWPWVYVMLIQANSSAQPDPFENCEWWAHIQAASHPSGWRRNCVCEVAPISHCNPMFSYLEQNASVFLETCLIRHK